MNAQFSEQNALYLSGEFNAGNYWGANLDLNYISQNKYSFMLGISGMFRESPSMPDDYSSGVEMIFTLGLSELHLDLMGTYHVLAGRIFELNKRRTIRLNAMGGIGYTEVSELTNWRHTGDTWGENYTYDRIEYGVISLIVNPKFEFPITRNVGFTASPMLQLNKDRTFIGIGIGAMLGVLRKKTSNPTNNKVL